MFAIILFDFAFQILRPVDQTMFTTWFDHFIHWCRKQVLSFLYFVVRASSASIFLYSSNRFFFFVYETRTEIFICFSIRLLHPQWSLYWYLLQSLYSHCKIFDLRQAHAKIKTEICYFFFCSFFPIFFSHAAIVIIIPCSQLVIVSHIEIYCLELGTVYKLHTQHKYLQCGPFLFILRIWITLLLDFSLFNTMVWNADRNH